MVSVDEHKAMIFGMQTKIWGGLHRDICTSYKNDNCSNTSCCGCFLQLVHNLHGCVKCIFTWRFIWRCLHDCTIRIISQRVQNSTWDHPNRPVTSHTLVCKLRKSLYGLKQAPRLSFSKLSTTLLSYGFTQRKTVYNLFIKNYDPVILTVMVNVDAILMCGNTMYDMITSSKCHMQHST